MLWLELSRAREVTSQPLLAELRLAWWQETIDLIYADQAPRAHEVALPLAELIRRRRLPKAPFDRLISARMDDTEEAAPESLGRLLERAEAQGMPLFDLAARIAGERSTSEAARQAGLAFALVAIVRAVPGDIQRGRLRLPIDVLAQRRLTPADALAGRDPIGLRAAAEGILVLARDAMGALRKLTVARGVRPAFYPATLAEGEARWLEGRPALAYPEHRMVLRLMRCKVTGIL